jgi:hypothetical protein
MDMLATTLKISGGSALGLLVPASLMVSSVRKECFNLLHISHCNFQSFCTWVELIQKLNLKLNQH